MANDSDESDDVDDNGHTDTAAAAAAGRLMPFDPLNKQTLSLQAEPSSVPCDVSSSSIRLSSSLGHLQLECVPEHLTEVDDEAESGPAAAATAARGLEQPGAVDVSISADTSAPVESTDMLFCFVQG